MRIEMRGMSRRPIIGICHGMEFISDVPALSIRGGIVDISGPQGGSEDRLICRIELGDVYGSRYSPCSRLRDARETSQMIRYNIRKESLFPWKYLIILHAYVKLELNNFILQNKN